MKRLTRTALGIIAGLCFFTPIWAGLGYGRTVTQAQAATASIAQSSGTQLTMGCNLVALTNLTVGMKVTDWVQANIQPASAVVSIWHFNNTSQHYQAAYFSDPNVPVDTPTFTSGTDGYFICVSSAATAPAP